MISSLFSTSKTGPRPGASASESGPSETATAGRNAPSQPAFEVTRKAVADCLKYVIDPEVGINIVDLGLVYDIELALPHISVSITMTTPACPLSGHISNHAYAVLERIRGVEDVDVEIVWQPAWSPQMMDPEVSERHFGRNFRR